MTWSRAVFRHAAPASAPSGALAAGARVVRAKKFTAVPSPRSVDWRCRTGVCGDGGAARAASSAPPGASAGGLSGPDGAAAAASARGRGGTGRRASRGGASGRGGSGPWNAGSTPGGGSSRAGGGGGGSGVGRRVWAAVSQWAPVLCCSARSWSRSRWALSGRATGGSGGGGGRGGGLAARGLGLRAGAGRLQIPESCGVWEGVREGGGVGGSRTQKFVYQKWPNKIFPIVNSVFPPRWSLWSGEGGGSGGGYPPSFYGARPF